MNIFNKGDIYGCSSIGTFSIRGHIGPAHHDHGSIIIDSDGLLVDVRAGMGTGSVISDLCSVRLPLSKNQFEDSKK